MKRSRKLDDGDEERESDDDEQDFTAPASVDLNALIPGVRWKAALETTVTGVKPLSDVKRVRWSISGPLGGDEEEAKKKTKKKDSKQQQQRKQQQKSKRLSSFSPLECSEGCADEELLVTLGPLQIRTFLVLPESGDAGGTETA